jgi:hypothetical protein
MKTPFFSLKNSLFVALSRLGEWFDPAQEGSPYELHSHATRMPEIKNPLFLKKRLSIRI